MANLRTVSVFQFGIADGEVLPPSLPGNEALAEIPHFRVSDTIIRTEFVQYPGI